MIPLLVSPKVFIWLQVNTLAAEKLYALAGDWAGLGPDTLLFDICCGTGTIGLTLAHRVGMVRFTGPFMCLVILFGTVWSSRCNNWYMYSVQFRSWGEGDNCKTITFCSLLDIWWYLGECSIIQECICSLDCSSFWPLNTFRLLASKWMLLQFQMLKEMLKSMV